MTDCPNAEMRDRLPDLLHEQLDASVRAALLAHLAECPDCQVELTLIREAHVTLTGTGRTIDVSEMARMVVARTQMPAGGSAPRRRRLDWRIAASIAVIAVGGASLLRLGGVTDRPATTAAPVASVAPMTAARVSAAPVPGAAVRETASVATRGAELSAAGGVGDLSESDLRALVHDLQNLDALPPTDPEPVTVRVALPGTDGSE